MSDDPVIRSITNGSAFLAAFNVASAFSHNLFAAAGIVSIFDFPFTIASLVFTKLISEECDVFASFGKLDPNLLGSSPVNASPLLGRCVGNSPSPIIPQVSNGAARTSRNFSMAASNFSISVGNWVRSCFVVATVSTRAVFKQLVVPQSSPASQTGSVLGSIVLKQPPAAVSQAFCEKHQRSLVAFVYVTCRAISSASPFVVSGVSTRIGCVLAVFLPPSLAEPCSMSLLCHNFPWGCREQAIVALKHSVVSASFHEKQGGSINVSPCTMQVAFKSIVVPSLPRRQPEGFYHFISKPQVCISCLLATGL